MARRRILAGAALAALIGVSSPVGADIAPPEPEDLDCPRGTVGTVPPVEPGATDPRGRPLRPWPYCAPTTCTSDADCDGARTCSEEEIGLCLEDREVGGRTVRAPRRRGCEPDGTCLNLQATCERARRCVAGPDASADEETPGPGAEIAEHPPGQGPAPEDEDPPPASPATSPADGCGCRTASGRPPPWAALLPPLALLLRRRAAPPRAS